MSAERYDYRDYDTHSATLRWSTTASGASTVQVRSAESSSRVDPRRAPSTWDSSKRSTASCHTAASSETAADRSAPSPCAERVAMFERASADGGTAKHAFSARGTAGATGAGRSVPADNRLAVQILAQAQILTQGADRIRRQPGVGDVPHEEANPLHEHRSTMIGGHVRLSLSMTWSAPRPPPLLIGPQVARVGHATPASSRYPRHSRATSPTTTRQVARVGHAISASSRYPRHSRATSPTATRQVARVGHAIPASSRYPCHSRATSPTATRQVARVGHATPASSRYPRHTRATSPTTTRQVA